MDIFPQDNLQRKLDSAASDRRVGTVRIHSGTYRPPAAGASLIHLRAAHDGLTIEAEGHVVLTAAAPNIADKSLSTFPAIVNHVVLIDDGVSSSTVIRGFTITGANGFRYTKAAENVSADDQRPAPGMFYILDGGAIKIFGRAYPVLENLTIVENATILCGGGISIEHRGYVQDRVRIRNCIVKGNRCPGTGSAIDVLEGSAAEIENCLFVNNIANTGMDSISREYGLRYNFQHGSGALTVFPGSVVQVRRCTFTGNWNGCDDKGRGNEYQDCIFWRNTAGNGSRPGGPYEMDILDGSRVTNCYLGGDVCDLRGTLRKDNNTIPAPDPMFDDVFRPTTLGYEEIGYRPTTDL
ncbi:MAG: right-handed parallel beta-helix repeat-containing protein [Fuerstiella sp.]